jgi:hypothetical protein
VEVVYEILGANLSLFHKCTYDGSFMTDDLLHWRRSPEWY